MATFWWVKVARNVKRCNPPGNNIPYVSLDPQMWLQAGLPTHIAHHSVDWCWKKSEFSRAEKVFGGEPTDCGVCVFFNRLSFRNETAKNTFIAFTKTRRGMMPHPRMRQVESPIPILRWSIKSSPKIILKGESKQPSQQQIECRHRGHIQLNWVTVSVDAIEETSDLFTQWRAHRVKIIVERALRNRLLWLNDHLKRTGKKFSFKSSLAIWQVRRHVRQ